MNDETWPKPIFEDNLPFRGFTQKWFLRVNDDGREELIMVATRNEPFTKLHSSFEVPDGVTKSDLLGGNEDVVQSLVFPCVDMLTRLIMDHQEEGSK